jgi:hypothetical protein
MAGRELAVDGRPHALTLVTIPIGSLTASTAPQMVAASFIEIESEMKHSPMPIFSAC